MIVKASAELMSEQGIHDFAQGVILQLAALLGLPPEGLICVRRTNQSNSESSDVEIIAAAGHYCRLIDHPLSDMDENEAKQMLIESLDNKCNVYGTHGIALFLGSQARSDTSCYVDSAQNIRDVDRDLLELFVSNISVCADNLELINKLKDFAYSDPLVGLPNRNAINERLSHLQGSVEASELSLAMLNIDGFAELSASLDREGGDALIKEISNRLRSAFPDTEVVARLEGDSFAVLGSESAITPESIMAVFAENLKLDTFSKKANITGGIVPLKAVEGDEGNALKYAGAVLKQAKAQNRGSVILYQYERD